MYNQFLRYQKYCCELEILLHNQIVENEKFISQIVRVTEVCDQNGDRVFKNDKSCNFGSVRLKGLSVINEKYWTLPIYLETFLKRVP